MKRQCYSEIYGQLKSYFFVGGLASIVEWTGFFILNNIFYVNYLFATALAFILSTYVNWFMGKKITFRKSASGMPIIKEMAFVYGISGIGLLFNLLLMFLLVGIGAMNAMFAKIIATGLVFFWNFIGRKILIYKV